MAGLAALVAAVTSLSGVVIGVQPETRTLFVAQGDGRVFMVLAPRVVPVGAVVRVRGDLLQTSNWTVLAAGTDGRLTRTGSAGAALVRGELGFVDRAKRRFQLGAHGQVVGWVSYPARLAPALLRLSRRVPQPASLLFHLRIRSGRLSLAGVSS